MRLDLPKQAPAVDRREHYLPFRVVVVAHPPGEDEFLVHQPPKGPFGGLPADPAPLVHGYGRGWKCAPTGGCRWAGVL
ncbi:hypothetical protein ACF09L_07090 [Streptomyces sp. NPDC014779]|uniref:hypothetical protein n=1 Tax=unclassified Streptomyces TaxID=2593676 RepID=UPI0033C3EFA9